MVLGAALLLLCLSQCICISRQHSGHIAKRRSRWHYRHHLRGYKDRYEDYLVFTGVQDNMQARVRDP